jgi:uncharacterized delta-60 repeat protein
VRGVIGPAGPAPTDQTATDKSPLVSLGKIGGAHVELIERFVDERQSNEPSGDHQRAPGGARTHNLQLRRLSLYPIELRVRQLARFAHSEVRIKRSELDFGRFRGWIGAVRTFLLLLAMVVGARAQDEVALSSAFGAGEGVNGEVLAVVVQDDGRIVIGGRFSAVNGIVRNNIARLNADGTLDRSFAEQDGVNGQVNALVIQPGGDIVVGGAFTQAGRREIENLARFHASGEVDEAFGGKTDPGANGGVFALAVQPDGKIVVGGNFNTVSGQPRRGIARLNADGTLDATTTAENALSGTVRAIAVGSDASLVAGGQFTLADRNARNVLRIPAR